MSDLLAAAEAYASCGLSVLPWKYQQRGQKWDKVPTRKWTVGLVPRMEAGDIKQHWSYNPADNIGVITGWPSDLVIVDCDTPEAKAWAAVHLPPTPWRVTTGRDAGGLHLGYRYPDLGKDGWLRSTAKIGCKHKKVTDLADPVHKECLFGGALCGLDIRGDGGYAAMPPSLHKTGRVYEWDTDADDLSDILAGLPTFDLKWLPNVEARSITERDRSEDLDWEAEDHGGDLQAAQSWVNLQPPAIEGGGGRNQTFKVAAALTRDFGLTLKQAWPVFEAYNQRCQPPWDEAALLGKFEDGFRKGTGKIGSRLNAGLDLDAVLLRGAPAVEQVQQEVPAQPAQQPAAPFQSALTPSAMTDENWIIWLAAQATKSGGLPFAKPNLETAARLSRDRPELFHELKGNLRGLIDLRDWSTEVRKVLKQSRSTGGGGLQSDARTEVILGQDEAIIRDLVLKTLNDLSGVFVTAGKLSYVDKAAKMVELHGGALRNLVTDNCKVVSFSSDLDMTTKKAGTLPTSVIAMLEGLLPDQLDTFRSVSLVTRAPFFTASGTLVSTPGYNEEAQAILIDCPVVDPSVFETTQDALDLISGIFSEFEFESSAEFANYIGAMLTPLVRPAYSGATPWLLVEANMPGGGKTLLADCLQIIYGYKPNRNILSYKEEEIEKTMLAILQETRPVVLFDNVKHAVDSPTIEAIATSGDEYQGRLLGKNENRACPVRQLFVITSNNCTMSPDAARRFMRVRLRRTRAVTTTTNAEKQAFAVPDLRAFVHEHRGFILSALIKLVQSWLDAGRPVADTVPLLPSFEAFCETVGAIMHHAGRTDWLANFDEARKRFAVNDEWGALFGIWYDTYKSTPRSLTDVFGLANQHSLLSGVTAKQTDHASKQSAFKRRLNDLRDYMDGGFRLLVEDDTARKGQSLYRLVKVEG